MRRLLVLLSCAVLMPSCAVTYMDWPSSSEWDHWNKNDLKRNDVMHFFINVCGLKSNRELRADDPRLSGNELVERRKSILINAEKCMLNNGFIYVDKPEGFIESKNGGRCRFEDSQQYPSCQSLKSNFRGLF